MKKHICGYQLLIVLLVVAVGIIMAACGQGSRSAPEKQAKQERLQQEAEKKPAGEKTGINSDKNNTRPLTVTLGGATAGGLWQAVGEAVGQAIRNEYPGSNFTYETGSGVGNVAKVARNQIELGLVATAEAAGAINGVPPFDQQYGNLKAVALLYDNTNWETIVLKSFADKYGIKSFADIARVKPPLRVSVNQVGNMIESQFREMFNLYGFTYDDIKSWGGEVLYQNYGNSLALMKDNRLDMTGGGSFQPYGAVVDLARVRDLVLLPVGEQAIQKMIAEWGSPGKATISKDAYAFMQEDVETFANGVFLMIADKVSDADVYKITKALYNTGVDYLHEAYAPISTPREKLPKVAPLQLHPAAAAFYREAGVLK